MTNDKLSEEEIEGLMGDVCDVLRDLSKNKAALREFLRDLLTPAEYRDTALRWRIVTMLSEGVPQRNIAESLGVSLSKITRGSRELADKKGGFAKALGVSRATSS